MSDSKQAFPKHFMDDTDGMTLRDWFAGQALAGLLAGDPNYLPGEYASRAYVIADEMLDEREGS